MDIGHPYTACGSHGLHETSVAALCTVTDL